MEPDRAGRQAFRARRARHLWRTQRQPGLWAPGLPCRPARDRARWIHEAAGFLSQRSACPRGRLPAVRGLPADGVCEMEKIGYQVGECILGALLVATSQQGICAILLGDEAAPLVRDLHRRFPRAELDRITTRNFARVAGFIASPLGELDLPLDPRGSDFERRVWDALRQIPAGR